MDNLNVVNDTQQAVVEPAVSTSETGAVSLGTPEDTDNAEFTVRKQSALENSGFRKMRLQNEQYKSEIDKLKQQISDMSDYDTLKQNSKLYLEKLANDSMLRDLERIQKIDPSVESLDSIGGDFVKLIENGVDATVAFLAVSKATEGKVSPKPPKTGAVGFSEKRERGYFSSRELDRLTEKDLENPAIFKKAMESLKKL